MARRWETKVVVMMSVVLRELGERVAEHLGTVTITVARVRVRIRSSRVGEETTMIEGKAVYVEVEKSEETEVEELVGLVEVRAGV